MYSICSFSACALILSAQRRVICLWFLMFNFKLTSGHSNISLTRLAKINKRYFTTDHRHETCNSETDAQDISGWQLQEQVNVPSDITFDRYTWGTGTVLQPGQLFALCNSQAVDFLLQQCNETAGLGINGNDALLLYSQDGDVMVRPRPQLC